MTEKELLDSARRLSGIERVQYLDKVCGSNIELRRQLESELELEVETQATVDSAEVSPDHKGALSGADHDSFDLEQVAATIDSSVNKPGESVRGERLAAGDQIGKFKLLQPLGEGGMGSVWKAEQNKPVKRLVALKVIKVGIGSQEVLARFEAERQALAMMNHVNIARILDAGETATGRPFFAMELVSGVPLTNYCDENCLGIDDRLRLFTSVCSGVQHAHQKGVVHRDLKPSNILVANIDGVATVKVIDFGLAKAINSTQALTDKSLFTGIGQILGTLKYMSPEQARIDAVDIDTRTDIYSLGVILYQLLSGSNPLDDQSLKDQSILKILELIREQDPLKPSRRLIDKSVQEVKAITENRRTDSMQLNRVLVGDLDWIVMKALEKDRARRYATASAFADDVDRYLRSDPIVARPPSVNYRVRKFVRKNRFAVTAASLLAFALIAGFIGTTFGMVRAIRAESIADQRFGEAEAARKSEAARATGESIAKENATRRLAQVEKSNQVLESIFDDLDISEVREGTEPLEAVLAKRLIRLDQQLADESIGDGSRTAEVRCRLGRTLISLGFPNESVPLLQDSITKLEAAFGPHDEKVLLTKHNLATALHHAGRLEEALDLGEQVLESMENVFGRNESRTLESQYNLGAIYMALGRLDDAVDTLRDTSQRMKVHLGLDHRSTRASMNGLAASLAAKGQLKEAIPVFESLMESDSVNRKGYSESSHITLVNNLASTYRQSGQYRKAAELLEGVLELSKQGLGAEHPKTFDTMNELASAYRSLGKLKDALPLYEQSLESSRSRLGSSHPRTLTSINDVAGIYQALGRVKEAIELYEQALAEASRKLGADHPGTLQLENNLATAYLSVGKTKEAEELFESTLAARIEKLGADNPETLKSMNNLAAVYFNTGRFELAIRHLKKTLEIRTRKLGPGHPDVIAGMNNLATAYSAAGNTKDSIEMLRTTVEAMNSALGPDHPHTLTITNNLAKALWFEGSVVEATPLLETTLSRMKKALGEEHPDTLESMDNLARVFGHASSWKKAIQMRQEILEIKAKSTSENHPDLIEPMHDLVNAYNSQSNYEKSVDCLKKILTMADSDEQYPVQKRDAYQVELGVAYRDNRQHELSIETLGEVVEKNWKNSKLTVAARELRQTMIQAGRRDEFQTSIDRELKLGKRIISQESPDRAMFLTMIGGELLQNGFEDQAEIILRESVNERTQDALDSIVNYESMYLLGKLLLKQEKHDESKKLLEKSLEGLNRIRTVQDSSTHVTDLTKKTLDSLIALAKATGNDEDLARWQAIRPADSSKKDD